MTIQPDHQRLERLERELADALGVSPSPDLVPRIRERLAAGPAVSRFGMRLIAVCACGLMAFGGALLFYAPAGESPARVASRTGSAEAPPPLLPSIIEQGIAPAPRAGATAARRRAPSLRPSSDLAAIEQLIAMLKEPSVDAGSLGQIAPLQLEVTELAVAPLEIAPLILNE